MRRKELSHYVCLPLLQIFGRKRCWTFARPRYNPPISGIQNPKLLTDCMTARTQDHESTELGSSSCADLFTRPDLG